ncbi:MAG: phage tail protein [Phormidesmis sp.]
MTRYPPVSFFFDVAFTGADFSRDVVETRFQSVTGLSTDMQTETVKEGGENRFEHILPIRTKSNPLVLKRGLVTDSKMVKWCMDALVNFEFQPVDMLVRLLHVNRPNDRAPADGPSPLMSWNVVNAWPKKWSVSDFNAEQNAIAIETLELNYSYFSIQS